VRAFVSNRQDVCRAECSGSIAKEPNEVERCDEVNDLYGGADKSLARPGMKQATATEDFDFHISYL
jgi:hypothetical protein